MAEPRGGKQGWLGGDDGEDGDGDDGEEEDQGVDQGRPLEQGAIIGRNGIEHRGGKKGGEKRNNLTTTWAMWAGKGEGRVDDAHGGEGDEGVVASEGGDGRDGERPEDYVGKMEEEGFDQKNEIEFFFCEYFDFVESGEEMVLSHPLHHTEQRRCNTQALDDEVGEVLSWTQHKEDVQSWGDIG